MGQGPQLLSDVKEGEEPGGWRTWADPGSQRSMVVIWGLLCLYILDLFKVGRLSSNLVHGLSVRGTPEGRRPREEW